MLRGWFRGASAGTRAACLIYHGLVFYFSLLPSDRLPEIFESFSDKLLHGIEFFVLFLMVRHALSWKLPLRSAAAALWSLFLGGLIEILQTRIPGRSGDLSDFWADAAGIAAAALLLMVRGRRSSASERKHDEIF